MLFGKIAKYREQMRKNQNMRTQASIQRKEEKVKALSETRKLREKDENLSKRISNEKKRISKTRTTSKMASALAKQIRANVKKRSKAPKSSGNDVPYWLKEKPKAPKW